MWGVGLCIEMRLEVTGVGCRLEVKGVGCRLEVKGVGCRVYPPIARPVHEPTRGGVREGPSV